MLLFVRMRSVCDRLLRPRNGLAISRNAVAERCNFRDIFQPSVCVVRTAFMDRIKSFPCCTPSYAVRAFDSVKWKAQCRYILINASSIPIAKRSHCTVNRTKPNFFAVRSGISCSTHFPWAGISSSSAISFAQGPVKAQRNLVFVKNGRFCGGVPWPG